MKIYAGKFKITAWSEQPCQEIASGKTFSRSSVKHIYSGDLNGESAVEYIIYYISETESKFVGLEFFKGSLNGRTGTLVLQHAGTMKDGVSTSSWAVLRASGTGGLGDIDGKGRYKTLNHEEAAYEFTVKNETT